MKNINDIFDFLTGNLPALENTDEGDIPLIYGTSFNNGVIKLVEVESEENIFQPPLITVSYLGTAFVQILPFTTSVVDKSNIIILKPKNKMTLSELYFYCFQINTTAKFGFHYGRRMNMARLRKVNVLEYDKSKYETKIDIKGLLPQIQLDEYYKINLLNKFLDINKIFDVVNAKSSGFSSYDIGEIPFISNGIMNNGIIGYVSPLDTDRVFNKKGICVSAFCEATIHNPPFLPRGNGGSGLIVLIPKKEMTHEVFVYYAAYINKYCSWRFSYGRMVTLARLKKMELPEITTPNNV
ncbi:restriction endonuclease subunit S [Polaribacter butkevichii]|uniref:Type I restriction modification DNA specificity domain-containing protein n=1 Tax=Polaribacter butkevichii TaxID=218490 RepID=A0A2P6CFB9_9FLAO|nr:restriction endonuclease subunit S [Polaribacter butkevichii]PQJ73612.1 hypothetical protein BTO14_10185 [Polaribacter butkevichii]